MAITYRDAGVDIDAGDELVERIKPLAARARTEHVLADVGGFAGLCRIPSGLEEPILVSGTDGVGTKLAVAFAANDHNTVGIDLVAMCVNDILTVGAKPLFFLDYFATGKLSIEQAESVIRGISRGCEESGCALLGGETAELPGFYKKGEYDLAGFAVGVIDRKKIIDGKSVREGDIVLGLGSSGLHSNGYSLARRVLLEHAALELSSVQSGMSASLADELLRPTRIYAKTIAACLPLGALRAMSHITGGGLEGNLPRTLPDGLGAELDASSWTRHPLFDLIARLGDVPAPEMRRTFNMGIGYCLVVAAESVARIREICEGCGERVFQIGRVVSMPGAKDEERVVFV